MESNSTTSRAFAILIVALLALSVAKFIFQDVHRLTYPVNDLTTPWVSARAWTQGNNPYGHSQELDNIWTAARGRSTGWEDYDPILDSLPMSYPPATPTLLAPLGALPWSSAVYTYLVGSTLLFVVMLLLLASKLGSRWNDPRRLYLIAFALAMAPLHSGIRQSNLSTLTIACLCAGVVFWAKKPRLSGTAIALAICLKPQVAFLFFAYPWLRRKWQTAFAELAACATIFSASLLWACFHHLDVVRAFLKDLTTWSFSSTGGASFYAPGLGKYQMLNLQVIAYQFTHSPKTANVVSWAVFVLLAALSAFLIYSRVSQKNEATGIAIISVLTLLPVYQRFYTASVFIFVLYWAVENWPSIKAKFVLLLMLPLLLPIAAMTQTGRISAFVESHRLGSHFFWNVILMPHVIWIELIVLLILLADLGRTPTIQPACSSC
jgi:hypothetical protein